MKIRRNKKPMLCVVCRRLAGRDSRRERRWLHESGISVGSTAYRERYSCTRVKKQWRLSREEMVRVVVSFLSSRERSHGWFGSAATNEANRVLGMSKGPRDSSRQGEPGQGMTGTKNGCLLDRSTSASTDFSAVSTRDRRSAKMSGLRQGGIRRIPVCVYRQPRASLEH